MVAVQGTSKREGGSIRVGDIEGGGGKGQHSPLTALEAFSLSFGRSSECGFGYEHRAGIVLAAAITCGLRCVSGERTERGQGAHGEVSSSFLPLLPLLNEWCQVQAEPFLPAQLCGRFGPSHPWPGPLSWSSSSCSEGPSSDHFPQPCTLPREPKDREPNPRSAARTVPRRKKGYCECCQEAYEELHGVSPCPTKQLLPGPF